MDGNDRWKNVLGLLLILIYAVSAAPICGKDQKLRRDENDLLVCCYTTRCNTSQRFEFCKQDQGHDRCVNCSSDSYTNDEINTAQWDEEINFCVLKPLCDSDELISVGNGCECNLAKGYWGVDSRNCQLNRNNCKQAGQQLKKTDGTCISCEGDKFKPEEGTYGICREKTKCKAGEEEVDPGSIKSDRRCQAIQIVITSTSAPPTITTNTEPPNEEKGNEDGASKLYWLLPVCMGSFVLICVAVYFCWKYRIQIQDSFGHLCSREHPDTRNRSQNQELEPFMNGISQNGHKGSDPNSNGSLNPDSSLHATGTNETDTTETCVKSVYDSDAIFPSFGDSIFDNDNNSSLEQNEGSLIGTQMSAASKSETPVVKTSANNTRSNSVYDTARTGSTGNIPNSDLFCSLDTTTSNTTQNHDIGEGPKSDNSLARNTNKTKTMATARTGSKGNIPESLNTTANNTTPNHREISNAKATSSGTGNTETPTNKTRPTATASRVTGNTEAPTDNEKPIAKVGPYIPEASTSSRPQDAPDNHDQRFPASPTTDGGIDIQTPVNEENTKLVASAPYPFEQPSHVNMPPEETSESLDDYVTMGGASLNVIETGGESQFSVDQRTSAGENGSGLRTVHGNLLAPPESTSTTSSNEPSLPSVESVPENPDSIT